MGNKFTVIGAGLMGRAAAWDLTERGHAVTLVDREESVLQKAAEFAPGATTVMASADDHQALAPLLKQADVAISCVPYTFNVALSKLCIESGTHFIDLGGNNDVVDAQFALDAQAKDAGVTIIPDCGLAPGMLSVWAMYGADELDTCDSIRMYCGGLPQNPEPPLNYMRLFSVNGLINEYIEPCRIISDGLLKTVEGMSGLESVEFPEPFTDLEAFYTSGGTSTLVETLKGRVDTLEYKTLRYVGHIQFFQRLNALGFLSSDGNINGMTPREFTQELLLRHLPDTGPDATLFRVDCEGEVDGKPRMLRIECIDRADEARGISSMMRCTAFPAAAIARMLADGTIALAGTQPQELVVPPDRLRTELAERDIIVDYLVSEDYTELAE